MPLPMTRPNRHRMQRQVVELAIGASAEGPAVHRELARPFWDRAVPELERCSIASRVRTNCCGSTAWSSISDRLTAPTGRRSFAES